MRQPGHGWWSITPTPVLMWLFEKPDWQSRKVWDEIESRLPSWYLPGRIHDWMLSQAMGWLGPGRVDSDRALGVWTLGRLGARGNELEAVLAATADESPGVRVVAIRAMRAAHVPFEFVMPVARRVLDEQERSGEERRWLFELLLGYVKELPPSDVDYLRGAALRIVKAESGDEGAAAAGLLGRLQPLPEAMIDELISLLEGDKAADNVRWYSVEEALGRCGPRAARAVPILIKRLGSGPTWNYITVIQALGRMGTPAAAAASVLGKLASSTQLPPDECIHAEAARLAVLGKQPSLLDAYLSMLDDPDAGVRKGALYAMGHLGDGDLGPARARVELVLSDPDAEVRSVALFILSWMGRDAEPSLPAIEGVRRSDPIEGVREAAKAAEDEIGRAVYMAR